MKTFGSSIALMLAAALLASLLVATPSAAGFGAASRFIYGVEQRDGLMVFVKLDPKTLGTVDEVAIGGGWTLRGDFTHTWSPDRRHLALGVGDKLHLIDVEQMHEDRTVDLGTGAYILWLQWSRPGTVVVLSTPFWADQLRELRWIALSSGRVERKLPLGAPVFGAQSAGAATLLLTGTREGDQGVGRGSRLFLRRVTPGGRMRTMAMPGVRTSLEAWRTRVAEPLPSRAREAVRIARADLAGRGGVSEDSVQAVSLRPKIGRLGCRPFGHGTGYIVTLASKGHYWQYGVTLTGEAGGEIDPPVACWFRELAERPPPTDYDLLRSRPGTRQVVDAHLVLGRGGRRAFVVTSTGPTFDVDLRTWRVRARFPSFRLGDPPPRHEFSWFADRPVRVGDKIAVSTPARIKLLNTRRFRVSRVGVEGAPSSIASSGKSLYLSPDPYGPIKELTCVSSTGKVRFSLPLGTVNEFQHGGQYGYARTQTDMAIIDLQRGRLIRRIRLPVPALLLPPQRGPVSDSLG